MKSQVLVPNVILTTNPDIASQFSNLEKRYTLFSAFLEDVKGSFQDDQYFILTTDNGSITKFEFSIQGNQLKSTPPKCVIEFIQTGGTFELELLQSYKRRLLASNGKRDFDKLVFYIAFGIGDDLAYWSRFQAVELFGATVFQNFDNPKTIQLTFTPGVGYHMILDSLESRFADDSILSDIELNNKQYQGFIHGPNPETELALTYRDDDFSINSDLLAKYLLGFNAFDGLYKKTLNGFFRALFGKSINVFFVGDDLFKQSFIKIPRPNNIPKDDPFNYEASYDALTKSGEMLINTAEGLKASAKRLGQGGQSFYKGFNSKSMNGVIAGFYSNLRGTQILNEYLSIETTLGAGAVGVGPQAQTLLAFTVEAEDDLRVEERKQKLKELVEKIKAGLKELSGDAIILNSESDKKIIEYFYESFSPEALAQLPLSRDLPIVLIGEERIIRAMLYGEKFTPNTTKSTPGELLPKNDRASAYLNADWLSKDLYGSQPTKDQATEFEKAILRNLNPSSAGFVEGKIDYSNFPIFRYNVPNPNILGITIDDNKAFYSLLTAGMSLVQNRVNEFSINLDRKRGTEEALDILTTEEARQYDEYQEKLGKFNADIKSELRELLYDSISDRFNSNNPVYKSKTGPSDTKSGIVDLQLLQASKSLRDAVDYVLHNDKTFFMLSSLSNISESIDSNPIFSYSNLPSPLVRKSQGEPDTPFGIKLNKTPQKKVNYSLEGPYGALDAVLDLRDLLSDQLGLSMGQESESFQKRKEQIFESLTPIIENIPDLDLVGKEKFTLVYLTMLETLAVAEVVKAGGDNSKLSPEMKALNNLFNKLSKGPTLNNSLSVCAIPPYEGILSDLNITLKGIEDSLESTRLYNDLVRAVDSYAFIVDITTLPFFNLCNFFWLGYPCLLYAKRPKLVGAVEEDVLDTLVSGPYLIQGLSHVITPSKCESSFVLMKAQMDL